MAERCDQTEEPQDVSDDTQSDHDASIVQPETLDDAPDSSTVTKGSGGEIVHVTNHWLAPTGGTTAAIASKIGGGGLGRFARRIALSSERSLGMARFGRFATRLAEFSHKDETLSIGITSTGRHNRQGLTAIGLATTWARWGHPTLLVLADGAHNGRPRSLRHTKPDLADLTEAIARGRLLPVPQPLTTVLDRLEVVSDTELGCSLARFADGGWINHLSDAFANRYTRVIWSLPAVDDSWSCSMFDGVLDVFVMSLRHGKAKKKPINRFAEEVRKLGSVPPIQVIWHR